jgi:hypothetical protein
MFKAHILFVEVVTLFSEDFSDICLFDANMVCVETQTMYFPKTLLTEVRLALTTVFQLRRTVTSRALDGLIRMIFNESLIQFEIGLAPLSSCGFSAMACT